MQNGFSGCEAAAGPSNPISGKCIAHAIAPLGRVSRLLEGTLAGALQRIERDTSYDPADPCVAGVVLVLDAARRQYLATQRLKRDTYGTSLSALLQDNTKLRHAITRTIHREPNLITGCNLLAGS
jgi:hypothetical protein